ncbi:MAG TPA: cytochrome c3 family protein [Gemmatimonadales bacterium]|nr:cytochrome c3 family protein [Gemmatimonadales bacterium]
MTRTRVTIAGGVLLGLGAVLAGVSLARGQRPQAPADTTAAQVQWGFPLPPVSGSGYSDISAAVPNGPWPELPGRLRGPEQPIFYRHDIHAGQYRIPCLYCHNNAANSFTANIPAVSTCMGCHQFIAAADSLGNPNPEIAKLVEAWNNRRSIEWVRVYKISEHAHFPHMRHVEARIACQECHGNVQQQPRVFAVRDVNNMGWCTNCHMRRGVTRDCTACHY